jgi:hypothetical protein
MKCVRTLLFGLVFFTPAYTQAGPIPPGAPEPALTVCASLGVGTPLNCLDLSGAIGVLGETFTTSALIPNIAEISITALYNPDPFISFGATTANLVAGPVTYAFLFGTPIVPGFYSVATSTGGVTVTNGVSGTTTLDNSGIYPAYISGYGTVGLVPTNLGVDLGTAPCVAGPGAPFTMTTVCGQGTVSSTFAPKFFDNLEALLTYTQDDIASVASWSGAVTLDSGPAVPEPTLLGLFGLAVVGLGVRRRRK